MKYRGSADTFVIVALILVSIGLFVVFGTLGWVKETKDARHGIGKYRGQNSVNAPEPKKFRPEHEGYTVTIDL